MKLTNFKFWIINRDRVYGGLMSVKFAYLTNDVVGHFIARYIFLDIASCHGQGGIMSVCEDDKTLLYYFRFHHS